MAPARELEPYIRQWSLAPNGTGRVTHSSFLQPVLYRGAPAMLKVAVSAEEKRGASLMAWWDGKGAARVLEMDAEAVLLEWAGGHGSLAAMAEADEDDAASLIICKVVADLHKPRAQRLPALVPLEENFRSLLVQSEGGTLDKCATTARTLLADPQDVRPLHGDIHHGNILDFGLRGWLAIDPKGVIGERGFDYANLFYNPDHPIAVADGRLARQLTLVCDAAGIERVRLLQWIVAWGGLSAIWSIKDGELQHVAPTLEVADAAFAELSK